MLNAVETAGATVARNPWYVVRTFARAEPTARFFIEQLGLVVASPMVVVPSPRARRFPWLREVHRVLMFPGYLFVAFDAADPIWRFIYRQPGVQDVLSASVEVPIPVPDGRDAVRRGTPTVEDLLARPETGLEALAAAVAPVTVGARARVLEGPLAGREGVCRRSSVERVTLLLSMMGAPRPTELPRGWVEEIEE